MDEFEDFLGAQEYVDDEGEDFGEDFGEDVLNEGPQFVAERNAFERAGVPRVDDVLRTIIGSDGRIPSKLEEINKRLYRMVMNDTDKFKTLVTVYFEKFKGELGLSEGDFSSLFSKIDQIPKIKYLNPIGYILGYYVLDKQRQINKERLKRVVKEILPVISEVKTPDVIRYARFWLLKLLI
jgi:hypothetical protein